MKKLKITVQERLRYDRELVFEVPEGFDDDRIERLLDSAEDEYSIDDVIRVLMRNGFELEGDYDTDLYSPDDVEIEIEEYEFIEEEGAE